MHENGDVLVKQEIFQQLVPRKSDKERLKEASKGTGSLHLESGWLSYLWSIIPGDRLYCNQTCHQRNWSSCCFQTMSGNWWWSVNAHVMHFSWTVQIQKWARKKWKCSTVNSTESTARPAQWQQRLWCSGKTQCRDSSTITDVCNTDVINVEMKIKNVKNVEKKI